MHRRLQFDKRENPASDRRYDSRAEVVIQAPSYVTGKDSPSATSAATIIDDEPIESHGLALAATCRAVAGGSVVDQYRLMTIQEVADLLQVPVSWVYGHTRLRSANRIPGIRLGKYWRFERADIAAWIEANRRKHHSRVG
jgi:excisionase family DNA binding protein